MRLHLIFLMTLFEKGFANQHKLKTAILLYQEQQMRPCTLITILNQNQQELMVENQKKWSKTMKMLLGYSEFQFITWNIETFLLNSSFAEDKRNFIFSTGCTIFITEENVVSVITQCTVVEFIREGVTKLFQKIRRLFNGYVTTYGKRIKGHVCIYAYFSLFGLETRFITKFSYF